MSSNIFDISQMFNPEFAQELTKLQTFSQEILEIKKKANTLYFEQNYMQSESEYQKVLDTFKTFSTEFGLKQKKEDDLELEQD